MKSFKERNQQSINKSEGINFQKPKVTRIHPGVFTGFCASVLLLGIVLISAVFHHRQTPIENPMPVSSSVVDNDDDQRWYQQEPNSLSVPQVKAETAEANSTVPVITAGQKREAQALQAAMDSPIKAPINDLATLVTHSGLSSENGAGIPPKATELALSTQQTTRLQQLFGDKKVTDERTQFLNQLAKNTDDDYLHTTLKKPLSPYVLQTGNLIPAILIGGINSELPGQLTAMVSQNVYDSIRGRYLLIPQGTKLILTYDANVAYGNRRLLVAVKRLIFPNGNSMDLKGMPAVDTMGFAGFHDQVDNHYFRTYGSAAMMGLLSAGFQLSQPQQSNMLTAPSASQATAAAMGQQIGQVAMGMMNKNLDIAPTLIIHPGYQFNVQVTADMVFPGSY